MYILVYMYTYSRVTSICIDLSKIKLFVFVFYGCTGVQVYGCTGMYNCIGENCYFTLKCKNKDMISKQLLPIYCDALVV